jgi:two-component system, NarL family, response regulator DegU
LRPDLVLMDVRMPSLDGLAATREIKQGHPETSVLMVTMQENPDYLLEAVKAGAAGYVLKGSPNSQIMNSIRRVLSRRTS